MQFAFWYHCKPAQNTSFCEEFAVCLCQLLRSRLTKIEIYYLFADDNLSRNTKIMYLSASNKWNDKPGMSNSWCFRLQGRGHGLWSDKPSAALDPGQDITKLLSPSCPSHLPVQILISAGLPAQPRALGYQGKQVFHTAAGFNLDHCAEAGYWLWAKWAS